MEDTCKKGDKMKNWKMNAKTIPSMSKDEAIAALKLVRLSSTSSEVKKTWIEALEKRISNLNCKG